MAETEKWQADRHAHMRTHTDREISIFPTIVSIPEKKRKQRKKSEKIRLDNKKVTRYWPPGERHWRVDFRGTEFKSLEIESTFVQWKIAKGTRGLGRWLSQ